MSLTLPHARSLLASTWAPVVLGASMSLAAFAAHAQAAAPASAASAAQDGAQSVTVTGVRTNGYTVDESSSATKLNLSPRETPQSITVFTREHLEDLHLTSLRAVLDETPGVYSNAYDSERVLFYSRGFLINNLLVDGVPALASFDTGSVDETLDTALYERVEIVRGANGLSAGAGNPAAAINLVRKHADARSLEMTGDFTLGSWHDKRIELDASTPLTADGKVRARVVAVGEDTDSFQRLYHKKRAVLYGIVDADLTPATRLSVGVDYQDNKPTGVTWGSFPLFYSDGRLANWSTSVTTAANWTFWNRKTETAFAQLRHGFDNGWKVQADVSRRTFKEDVRLFYASGFVDATDGSGLTGYAYESRNKIVENALDVHATGPFELLGRHHELVLGYNGSRAHNVGTENATEDDLPELGNFLTWDGSYALPTFSAATLLSDIHTRQDAVYAAARLSLADPLKLIAGVRYAKTQVDSYYVYDTTSGDGLSRYDFHKAIPYAGLVWDLSHDFSAFTSYTGIFQPQSNRDVDGRYLDPMTGHSIEVGLKGEHFNRRLTTALTLFVTKQDNVAAPAVDADGNTLPPGANGVIPSRAIAGTKTSGFEFEVAGSFTPELKGSLGWTHNTSKVGAQDTFRTYIPDTLVRSFLTWEPKSLVPGLALGGGVNWQSASSTKVTSPTGSVPLRQAPVALLDLMARYEFSRQVSLQANAGNVTNRKYYVLDEYENTHYGTPANWSLTLRLAY